MTGPFAGKASPLDWRLWLGRPNTTGATIMTSRKTLDWMSKLAFSASATLTATYLAAIILTYRVF